MTQFRICLKAGLGAACLFLFGQWLLMEESSPFHRYFLFHVGVPNLWRLIHTVPYFFGIMLSGNAHQASAFGYFAGGIIQWFFIGMTAALPLSLFANTKSLQNGHP
jgi:hypothetical protein